MNDPASADALQAKNVRVALSSDTFDNIISRLDENEVVKNYKKGSYIAYNIYKGTLKGKETKEFRLREWLDYNATKDEAMNKVYKSSINVVAGIENVEKEIEIKTKYIDGELIGALTEEAQNAKYCITKENECNPEESLTLNGKETRLTWQTDNETSVCSRINDTGKIYCSEVIFDVTPPSIPSVRLENGILYFEGSHDNEGGVKYYYSEGCTDEYIEGDRVEVSGAKDICVYAKDSAGNESDVLRKTVNVMAALTTTPAEKYYCQDTGLYQNEERCFKEEQKQYKETYNQTCNSNTVTSYNWNSGSVSQANTCSESDPGCSVGTDVNKQKVTCSKVTQYDYQFGNEETSYNKNCTAASIACDVNHVNQVNRTCEWVPNYTYAFDAPSSINTKDCTNSSFATCDANHAGQTSVSCSWNTNYSYYWSSDTPFSGQPSCVANEIACDASHLNNTYRSCTANTTYSYSWSSGTTTEVSGSCTDSTQSCSAPTNGNNTKITCTLKSAATYGWITGTTLTDQTSCTESNTNVSCNSSTNGTSKVTCNKTSSVSYNFQSSSQSGLTTCTVSKDETRVCDQSKEGMVYEECERTYRYSWGTSKTTTGLSTCQNMILPACNSSTANRTSTTCTRTGTTWKQETKKCVATATGWKKTTYTCTKTGSDKWTKTTQTCQMTADVKYNKLTQSCVVTPNTTYSGITKTCSRTDNGDFTKTSTYCRATDNGQFTIKTKTCNQIDASYYDKTTQTCSAYPTTTKTFGNPTLASHEGGCSEGNPGCQVISNNCQVNGTICTVNESCTGTCMATCDISYNGEKKYYCDITDEYYATEEEATSACSNHCDDGYEFHDGNCIQVV